MADTTGFVSKQVLDKVYDAMQDATPETDEDGQAVVDVENHLFFINAFEMPFFQFSLERQTFEK